LESGEFNRLGDTKNTRRTNVRSIAAAGPNLPELMKRGEFYPDLYYRLEHFVIHLPPLRERREDIVELAEHFLKKFAAEHKRAVAVFSDDARARLQGYFWPGNVRELRNAVNRAVILAENEIIQIDDLPPALRETAAVATVELDAANFRDGKQRAVEKFERDFISDALKKTRGNISEAARRTGMHKKNLIQKMQQYGIRREDFAQNER
jgi:Nif-specific regulatory protein